MVDLRQFVKPYRKAGAVNSVFAPHRFIDDQVFLTKGNQLGIVLAIGGIDPECLTDETLESVAKRMAAAWRGFDEHFRLYQYVVKQDRAPIVSQEHTNSAVAATVAHRNGHLQAKAAGLYTLELVYVILYEPLAAPGVGHAFSNKRVLRILASELSQNRDKLVARAQAFCRTVGDLIAPQILGKAEAFQFLRLLTNLNPEIADAERLKYDSHVDFYLASSQFACGDGLKVGDARVAVLSLREPPTSTFPNVFRDLLALECNFILRSEFRRVPHEKAVATIRGAQNHWHWTQWVSDIPSILSMVLNRGNRENVIADKSAVNDVEEMDDTLARINNGGEYLGEFSLTVVLYGWEDQPRMDRAAADVVKIFGRHEASAIRETYNALNAYLAIIPGNTAFNLRKTWLLSANYADLSFLYAPASGDQRNGHLQAEYLVALETNEATPYYFNLHDADRFGVLIFGAPGAGKSVLTNLFVDHSQKYSPRTFLLDRGGSYRQITRKYGGAYVEMRLGADQSFRINPFCLPNTGENLQFLFSFVRLLLTNGGYAPTVTDDRELYDAIEGLYILRPEHRTLHNLALGLPPHLFPALQPWIDKGQYGSVFDNVEDTLTFSEFQVFDFQGMDELYPQVMAPILFYLFQRISQVVYDPALVSVPKQLWADEVWRFLANETARSYLVAAGKTWRKHNGGIGLVTQSAADLRTAGVLELVNEICPTKILLANPGADHAEYQRLFHLNAKETELFAGLIPKRQFLWKTAERSKVLNVDLDPQAFWQYANSPQENARRQAAISEFGAEKGLEMLAGEAR